MNIPIGNITMSKAKPEISVVENPVRYGRRRTQIIFIPWNGCGA